MAGNFRIDVVVSGGAATGTGTALPVTATAPFVAGGTRALKTGLGSLKPGDPVRSALSNVFLGNQPTDTLNRGQLETLSNKYEQDLLRRSTFAKIGKPKGVDVNISGKQRFFRSSILTIDGEVQGSNGKNYTETGRLVKVGPAILEQENLSRLKALGSATAAKIVYSAVQYAQHTSGDSYYNQQLSNAMRLGGYGLLLVNSGPAAPFVAVGILANESVDAILGVAKYDFDRKIEAYEITNNKMIAGNASYGRNRGVGV